MGSSTVCMSNRRKRITGRRDGRLLFNLSDVVSTPSDRLSLLASPSYSLSLHPYSQIISAVLSSFRLDSTSPSLDLKRAAVKGDQREFCVSPLCITLKELCSCCCLPPTQVPAVLCRTFHSITTATMDLLPKTSTRHPVTPARTGSTCESYPRTGTRRTGSESWRHSFLPIPSMHARRSSS